MRRASQDARQTRRLLALAVAYEGATRTRAAEIGGVTLQVVRDWVVRFNTHGPECLIDCKAPGQPSRLDGQHRAALAAVIESGPVPAIHGVVRWRLIDLCQWLWDELRISVSRQTLGRALHAMDYRKLSVRPRHHAQAEGAIEALTRDFPDHLDAIAREHGIDPSDVEVWFGDEVRIGQKNKITRRWARRGTRPCAPQNQRTASTCIFGAICPKQGEAAGLVLPWCNTKAMNLHRAAISAQVAPGRHAVLLVDQAGWHTSAKLAVPANITLVPLPAKCPELNPQENVWQFMRENWLSNRVFTSYDNLVDHCCAVGNKLLDQPWRIMSLRLRACAHEY